MLTPLRSALDGWRPRRRGPGLGTLDAIVLAWPEIVGPQLAAATQPLSLAGDALVVTTASSAWSQQLSFLVPEILRGLHEIAQAQGVARIRFRVGTLRRAAAPRRGQALPNERRHVAAGEPAPPAADPGEALERLKAAFERRPAPAGEPPCRRCGIPIAGGDYCAPCAGTLGEERDVAVQRLMYDAPWLGYRGTAAVFPALSVEDYERIRRGLLERWWGLLLRAKAGGRLSGDGRERRIASSYVVLQTGQEPQRITPAVVRNILGDDLASLLYGGGSTESDQTTR